MSKLSEALDSLSHARKMFDVVHEHDQHMGRHLIMREIDFKLSSAERKLKSIHEKRELGWTGWDQPENKELLKQKLLENYREEDWVDVANLALFLWNLEPTEES